MLDILGLEPTNISGDLRGKYVLLYGNPKTGKTTLASQFPKSLLLAFEKGYNALGGIYAQDIEKWSDFKAVLKQLNKAEAKEKYETIVIDTVGIAWDLCEKFVCAQKGVSQIGAVPFGQGWTALKKEFDSSLRQITMMGYGLVMIAHAKTGQDEKGNITSVAPDITNSPYQVVNRLADVIGFIRVEYGEENNEIVSKRTLRVKPHPIIMAGTRFKYLPDEIEFSYENFAAALKVAIEKEAEEKGVEITQEKNVSKPIISKRSFEEMQGEARELWITLIAQDEANAEKVLDKVEEIFGIRKKISEITARESEMYELLIIDMREMIK